MAHTIEEKKKLLNRVRRIMGQNGCHRKISGSGSDVEVLHTISRGAMDALMAELIEGYIRRPILLKTVRRRMRKRAASMNWITPYARTVST